MTSIRHFAPQWGYRMEKPGNFRRKPIYLDNHATTPLDPRVLEAMLPYFQGKFGNAASRSHSFGWEAEKAVDFARKRIADLAGSSPREIIFTSGATESNNLAIKGVGGAHIVTMATEHKAVLDPLKRLAKAGVRTTELKPGPDGLVDLDALRAAIQPDTSLVSIMFANNEIGVVQPVREIGAICRERGVLFHCDAAQAFGKLPIRVAEDHIDLMSVSAHKMYGPKGIGALYVRRRVPLQAQMDGGGHEFGMRSGTLNVPAIVGFGEACAIAAREMDADAVRLRGLRDRLRECLMTGLEGVHVNGSMEHRLPGNLNVSIEGVDGEALLMSLPDVALSTGSACTSATVEPSFVLRAIGLSDRLAHSSLRFGLGRFTTAEEIDYAANRVVESVRKLRALSPML
jgi:cysteine desulfurase